MGAAGAMGATGATATGASYVATGALYSWATTGVCTTVAGTSRGAGALYSAEGAVGSSKPVAQSTGGAAAAATGAGDTSATGAVATGAAAMGATAPSDELPLHINIFFARLNR